MKIPSTSKSEYLSGTWKFCGIGWFSFFSVAVSGSRFFWFGVGVGVETTRSFTTVCPVF